MMILGPLPWSTTSAVTLAFASAAASEVTASPSTRSSAGSVTVSPGPLDRRSTVMVSPTATLCWWPPARTIAYTGELLDAVLGLVGGSGPGYGSWPGRVKPSWLGPHPAWLSGHLVRIGHFAHRGEPPS